ncbi:MAG: Transcriptional regulator, TetR family [Myxococcaceae bacterium]|nr:Transcriptional regulator, TetR family [Myxococcaceae bacterium]
MAVSSPAPVPLSHTDPSRTPEPAPRKERNALETKRRILEAAESEFAAKGFDGARLGTIARAAAVQQALIHHYFGDKEGLHGEVVRSGLAAMTEGVWELLSRMDAPPGNAKAKPSASSKTQVKKAGAAKTTSKAAAAKTSVNELRTLAEAFVELLLKFFATNGSFLAILRHEARRDGAGAAKIVHGSVGPIFDGVVARLDAMRARGDVKKDVDARHLVLSCVAMVAFPFQEEPFVKAIWPADWHGEAFLEERKKHIVAMILARVAP